MNGYPYLKIPAFQNAQLLSDACSVEIDFPALQQDAELHPCLLHLTKHIKPSNLVLDGDSSPREIRCIELHLLEICRVVWIIDPVCLLSYGCVPFLYIDVVVVSH